MTKSSYKPHGVPVVHTLKLTEVGRSGDNDSEVISDCDANSSKLCLDIIDPIELGELERPGREGGRERLRSCMD